MHRLALIWAAGALVAGCDGGPSAASQRVTLTAVNFTGGAGELDWVAVREDEGKAWRPVTGSGGRYTLTVGSGRYAVAFHCLHSEFAEVILATAAELDTITVPCTRLLTTEPLHRVRGRFTDADSTNASVTFARIFDGYVAQLTGESYMIDLPAGTFDLGAYRRGTPARAILQRDLMVDRAMNLDLDFSGGLALATVEVSLTGLDRQESPSAHTTLHTRTGRSIQLLADEGRPYRFAPQDLDPGETQDLSVRAVAASGSERGIIQTLPRGDEMTLPLTLPPATGDVKIQIDLASGRPALSFTPWPGATFYQLTMSPLVGAGEVTSWIMNVGAGWLGSERGFTLPDLSAVAGFNPAWGPTKDAQLVTFTAVASNRGFGPTLNGDGTPPPGSMVTYAKQVTNLPPRR